MSVKNIRKSMYLTIAVTGLLAGPAHAQQVSSIEEAPNLKAGSIPADGGNQCYARVNVPATYRSEDVKTEIRPKLARFKITPSVFKDGMETVTIQPEMTKITAVQPVIEERTEKLEIMGSSKAWVRGSLKGTAPLTEGEMVDIKNAGIDIDAVAPGTCLYEHYTEATIEDKPTKVLVSEATEKLSVTDAVLKNEVATVVVKPAFTRLVEVPPTFKDGIEKVMTASATKRWQSKCNVQQVDHMTGETLCLVDVAAQFENVPTKLIDIPALITKVNEKPVNKNVKIQTLVSDAAEKREAIPAEFDFIDRMQVSKPASYTWIAKTAKVPYGSKATGRAACFVETPAKFAEYTRKVVKTAGRFDIEKVPAKTQQVKLETLAAEAKSTQFMEAPQFKTVKRQVLVNDSKIEWKPVLCEVNFSKDIIAQLQQALTKRGYEPGPVDGIMGRGTSNAIREYQKDNKMADGGLTIETLKKLGVKM